MSTPAQPAASRANAALSTGPTSAAGKAVSRFNPLRHGLTSQHLIIPGENPEDFHALHEELRISWDPANAEEENLVAQIAEGEWRMIRARRVETATLKMYMERILAETPAGQTPDYDLALAQVYERYGKELDRLRRYETTISRALAKAQRSLGELGDARLTAESEEPDTEAAPESTGEPTETPGVSFVSQNRNEPAAARTHPASATLESHRNPVVMPERKAS